MGYWVIRVSEFSEFTVFSGAYEGLADYSGGFGL